MNRPALYKSVEDSLEERILPEVFLQGLSKARLTGRCQRVTVDEYPNIIWFLDGAHTRESLEVLLGSLVCLSVHLTAVFLCPRRHAESGSPSRWPRWPTRIRK